ncbi:MAG TPA: spore coat protein [Clostridia bacterium]|nr:spore coat protein [Clostridia bacterium]
MVSLLQSMMGSAGFKMNDRVIANDALMGLKGGAVAYLGAILESATPEVRRMYSEYLTQLIMAHEAMTALAVKKGWYQPYLSPGEQLQATYQQAEWVLNTQ